MNLKSILKSLKLNEGTISMLLGALVIVVVGVLVVNYFRGKEGGLTLPTGEITESQEGPTVIRGGEIFHIVQSGDNLWKIAEKYYNSGYNWVDIAKENKLANASLIEKNQQLLIPKVEPKIATVKGVSTEKEVTTGKVETATAVSGATYTVVKGDNLWDIAVRAYGDGYKWVEIAKENKLANPTLIHPGNVFTLPR